MLNLFLRPLRLVVQMLTANDTARQTTWGFALGMMVGLLPKGTLLAIGLAVVLCAIRVNRAAALLAIGVFSMIGAGLDSSAHNLGSLVLLWEPARETFKWLYDMPLGPWLGFNNTVVMGQLIFGLYLFYPAYKFAYMMGDRVQPRVTSYLMKYKAIRWLKGAEVGVQWGFDQ
jgi:uncharacterized protein (TIGR03546 family)